MWLNIGLTVVAEVTPKSGPVEFEAQESSGFYKMHGREENECLRHRIPGEFTGEQPKDQARGWWNSPWQNSISEPNIKIAELNSQLAINGYTRITDDWVSTRREGFYNVGSGTREGEG